MKKFLLLSFCTVIFLCTGCVKHTYTIEINDNDTINFSETQAINIDLIQSMMGDVKDEFSNDTKKIVDEFTQKGYIAEEYNEPPFQGAKISKNGIPINDFNNILPKHIKQINETPISIEENWQKKSYKIHFVVDKNKMADLNNNNNEQSLNSNSNYTVTENKSNTSNVSQFTPDFGKDLDNSIGGVPGIIPVLSLSIIVPENAIVTRNNATKVKNNREYVWNFIQKEELITVNLEYEIVKSYTNIFYIIGGLLILMLLLTLKSSNKKQQKGSINIANFSNKR